MRRVRKSVNYQLGSDLDLAFEYLRTTAVTKGAAIPHEHRYFWIDDPDNEVGVENFRLALEDHLEYTMNALPEHHEIDPHGEDGAITVRHSPPLVDETPEHEDAIREACTEMDGVDERLQNTRGAQYIASQLPHLFLGDKFDATKQTPVSTLIEGGAIDLATPSRWVGFSQGVPGLGER
jgi:hypothetical protein